MNLLYQQKDFPIFQNRMYETAEEARHCPKGDIKLIEDQQTGLTSNVAFQPELMVYDDNYQNEQAFSPLFERHLNTVAHIVEQNMGRRHLVEVGCGKGYFLELLLTRGVDVTGFDPTYEGANPHVKRKYFGSGIIEQSQGLILRHVLEHIQNPVGFLQQLKLANGSQGKVYIEVPCFDWICTHRAWFDIFYEHVNYFRLSDLRRMFGKIIDSGKLFGGQYLYVVAELATLKNPEIDLDDRVVFPVDFTSSIARFKDKQATIWGGHQRVLFLRF